MRDDFDAIVIGSGLGGLASAAVLAKLQGKRVLVLERHYVLGGFTHTFKRPASSGGRFEWDVGIHYVGGVGPGSAGRRMFDFITDGQLEWARLPDPYDRFKFPGMEFGVYGDKQRWIEDLVDRFPDEASAIHRYVADIKRAERWLSAWMGAGATWPTLGSITRKLLHRFGKVARGTVTEYLDANFRDPKLKAILTAIWGTYGVPPSQASFAVHGLLIRHYMHGAWYPVGGAARIAETVVPVIEAAGGQALTSREVKRVLVEGGKAAGVEAVDRHGKVHTYRAPVVISNAGALTTYRHFVPSKLAEPYLPPLEAMADRCPSGAVVYFGLRDDPRKLGFDGANYWLFDSFDHEKNAESRPVVNGDPGLVYVSFPSLKNPHASSHTMEAMCPLDPSFVKQWRDARWRRRGAEYEALKERIASGMIAKIEAHRPGFKAMLEHVEVSTPLSVEHFTGWTGGAIYGIPHTAERYAMRWLGIHTPVRGLLMTGADAFCFGVLGALFSGAATAGVAMGAFGTMRVLSAVRRGIPDGRRPQIAPA